MGQAPNYGYEYSTEEDGSGTNHQLTIAGLSAGADYYFKAVSKGQGSALSGQLTINTDQCCQVLGESGYPVLAMEKKIDRIFTNPGDKGITYTIEITNSGNLTAFNLVLSDILPAGLSFDGTSTAASSWALGDLEAGETKEISYQVSADPNIKEGFYRNSALLTADNHDSLEAAADLEIRLVKILASTGFDPKEALWLALAVIALFTTSLFLNRRTA
jgi:uncharacterized repeat protein (TIGR01451 family)